MPVFIRRPPLLNSVFRIFYDPDDPVKEIGRQRVPPGESEDGPEDGLSGHVAVSIRLGKLLAGAGQWPDVVSHPPPRQAPKGLVARLAGPAPRRRCSGLLEHSVRSYPCEVFETRADEGAQGSGDDWAALVRVLIAERMPELADAVDLDPDAQELLRPESSGKIQTALKRLGDNLDEAKELFAKAQLE